MGIEPLIFGLGCAVSAWFAGQSRDRDVRLLALALIPLWALMNLAWMLDAFWLFPLLDLAVGYVGLRVWAVRRAGWATTFCSTIFVRLELHVLDCLTGHAFVEAYLHALNATFVWMLVAVALPGGRNGLARCDGMRRSLLSAVPRVALRPAWKMNHGG